MQILSIPSFTPIQTENAGLFISQGIGRHPDRVIDSHELIFVRSGTLHIEEDRQTFSVEKHESLLLRPNKRHRGTQDYSSDLSFYWIHFHIPKFSSKKKLSIPHYGKPSNPDRMTDLFRRFLDEQESGSQTPQKNACLMMLMLLEIHPAPDTPHQINALAAKAHDYIATHFQYGIHAGTVAQALGYNSDYLGRIYRQVHRHTLSHAIHLCQLREARALLRDGTDNLEEISRKCGFPNSRYFRKLFVFQQGMNPRAYRKLYTRLYINTK